MIGQTKKYPKNSVILVAVLIVADIFFSVVNAINLSVDFFGLIGIVCLVIASALFACLIILTRSFYVFLMFAPSFVISLIISGEFIFAFAGLAYIPLGFLLSLGLKQKLTRTQIILRLSVAMMIFYAVTIVLTFVLTLGEFSPEIVKDAIDREAEEFIDYYNSVVSNYVNIGQDDGNAPIIMEESEKRAYVESLKAILPSVFILYCNIISFFATFAFRILYNFIVIQLHFPASLKYHKIIYRNDWKITMSLVSTIVFVLCIIFMSLLSENIWVVIALSNIVYILTPGLFIIGFSFIYEKVMDLCNYNYVLMVIVLFILAFVLFLFSPFALMVVVFFGIYSVQSVEFKKLVEKIKKSFDNFDNDNDEY